MVISLDGCRSRRRLRDGSRLPASASNLMAAESEIAAGRIALFTLPKQAWSLLLSRSRRTVPIWTVDRSGDPPPWLSPGTLALCSPDFPLAHRQRPSPRPLDALFTCKRAKRARRPLGPSGRYRVHMVPKGRFELPRGYPHYALNVARLPVPPLRPVDCHREIWSRPWDSNPRPAVYETAALPLS